MKILLFGFVFVLGVALGGVVRHQTIAAQFAKVKVTNTIMPATAAPLGGGGGGSCG